MTSNPSTVARTLDQVTSPTVAKVQLRVLSNSELRTARSCMRRHYYQYRMLRRPRVDAEPLTFGSLYHAGQEGYWSCDGELEERLDCAIDAIRKHVDEAAKKAAAGKGERINEFMIVTVEELTRGYVARWADSDLRAVAVEQQFDLPLVNPETGAPSRTFRLGGKFDGIVVDSAGKLRVIEHKTTTSDIESGSMYWSKVRELDTQVSLYLKGARAAGYDVEDCVYDVVRKPGIQPLKATPEESRKYTSRKDRACKECKKKNPLPGPHVELVKDDDGIEREAHCVDGRIVTDEGNRLYANMREHDETSEEYRLRVRADIAERPERYYARESIVRLDAEDLEFSYDLWQSAKLLHEAERAGFAPKNPDNCATFGGCPYLPVCTRQASIEDEMLYRTASSTHEELEIVQ